MQSELVRAIEERRYVTFIYDGVAREVQPAALGDLTTGVLALRCYQTAGGHVTSGHEWNLCKVEKIRQLQVLSKTFSENPPGYRRGDKQMVSVYAQL